MGNPKWESIIDNTGAMLSSWKDIERRGSIIGEMMRTNSKMAKHPEQFTSCSSIEGTPGLFLYRWYLLGETGFIFEDEAQLVEAALGRIKMLAMRQESFRWAIRLESRHQLFQEKVSFIHCYR
ncbi:hypothetical protein BGZ49_002294 [Haplosporangium sp. Z 27]|nr:hypothetical protein BGZ49_002294 [Haplosporangium sp. Z 27]